MERWPLCSIGNALWRGRLRYRIATVAQCVGPVLSPILFALVQQLQKETAEFVKRSTQWVALVGTFNQSLKYVCVALGLVEKANSLFFLDANCIGREIGDIENWSRTIESDMAEITTMLTTVHARASPQ